MLVSSPAGCTGLEAPRRERELSALCARLAAGFAAAALSVTCLLCEMTSFTIAECGLNLPLGPHPRPVPPAPAVVESGYGVWDLCDKCAHKGAG